MRTYRCLGRNEFFENGLRLVPIRDEDKNLLMKWRNEQIHHLRQAAPLTPESQEKYFKEVISPLFEKDKPGQLLFSLLKDESCIGYGGLVHMNWIDHHAEVSFLMDTSLQAEYFDTFWSSFLRMISQVAFTELGFRKIFTYAFDIRPHLYPVLINAGYVQEARLKDHCLIEGRYYDVLIHSLFNPNDHLQKS